MRRRLRHSGGETVEARAQRLGEVALAGRRATGAPTEPELVAFFVAGFLACRDDVVQPPTPRTKP